MDTNSKQALSKLDPYVKDKNYVLRVGDWPRIVMTHVTNVAE